MPRKDPLAALPNLGPRSASMLRKGGIRDVETLRRLGPVRAYWMVKRKGLKPSLNLLYALAGALTNTHWAKLPRDERSRLLLEADALEDAARRR
jgi:DNA transformation protein and related proteins